MSASNRDLSWLDAPLLTPAGRRFNSAIGWFIDELPMRAQRVLLKAARGELTPLRLPLPPVRTLREFASLPAHRLLVQRGYARRTHADVCRVFQEYGVAEPFSATNRPSLSA